MTERERIRADEEPHPETVDELLAATRPIRAPVLSGAAPYAGPSTLVVMPVDRVRWAAVLTGLFAALATLAILGLLGLAVGLSTLNPGNPIGMLGIGADIWGAISALIALAIGGWAAARTAAVPGRANGALNGAMVWAATVPLMLWLLGGISALGAVAGGAVATGAQVAAPMVGQPASDPALQATAQALQATAQALANQAATGSAPSAATTSSVVAWGTLLALCLTLVAATLGGLLGAHSVTDLTTTWLLPPDHLSPGV